MAILSLPQKDDRRRSILSRDILVTLACVGLLAFMAVVKYAAGNLPAGSDNDSMLRLVTVRDLIAGQGWFDGYQYRMGFPGGFEMHWSRLVDAPIAAIILAANAFGLDGEVFAGFAWPYLLMALSIYAVVRSTRIYAGEAAVLPAAVLATATFFVSSLFKRDAFDHHNMQLMLSLFLLLAFFDDRQPLRRGFAAGAIAAAMLAIGLETVHFVAAAGATAVFLFIAEGERGRRFAAAFGAGFAVAIPAIGLSTLGPARLFAEACDAMSAVHLVMGMAGGFGLAALALASQRADVVRRAVYSALLGTALAALAVILFPACLGDPYAGLDQRLHDYWLDGITEARPLLSFLKADPAIVAVNLATPLIGLAYVALRIARRGMSHKELVLGAFLAAAVGVSLWQARGGYFSTAIAVVALAAMVAEARTAAMSAAKETSLRATLLMVFAWIGSVNAVWGMGTSTVMKLIDPPSVGETVTEATGDEDAGIPALSVADTECLSADALSGLAALPAQGVLAVSNLGSAILLHTPHRAIAGPYHRNVAGIGLAIDSFAGPAENVPRLMQSAGLSLYVHCPGNPETGFFAGRAPEGFMALMEAGKVPAWLEPVPAAGTTSVQVYRIRPSALTE